MSKNIIWLASYPKSGNTWFRSFLTALTTGTEVNLDKMNTDGIFSNKVVLEKTLDLDADHLLPHQIEEYQRIVYNYLSKTADKPKFIKIHDAFTFSKNTPLIPEEATKVAIYLIRNPLDVTLSLANHVGLNVDQTIEKYITNPNGAFIKRKSSASTQFHQPLGSWNMHVESWLSKPKFPVHFVKYEDLKTKPFLVFSDALKAMGLTYSEEQIQNAIAETEFEKLQKKEKEKGFKEKPIDSVAFFRKGKVGSWREELTIEQIQKIKTANEPMMRHFNYWED
jgi:hypothetical protein